MTDLHNARIGCCMTGSFCTFEKAFAAFEQLRAAGAELYPIMSYNAYDLDTRFGTAREMRARLEKIARRPLWHTLEAVEPIGPKKLLDLLVIAPCTGNTLSKLAHGVCDTPAAMAAKSHLRNGRNVLIAVSTNDGLGRSAQNIGVLQAMKQFFFVPYGQDDWRNKPQSLVASMELLPAAAREALAGRQMQPVLLGARPDSSGNEKNS